MSLIFPENFTETIPETSLFAVDCAMTNTQKNYRGYKNTDAKGKVCLSWKTADLTDFDISK